VLYTLALPFTLKKSIYLKAKDRGSMETQIFHHAKIYLIFTKKKKKKTSKINQNLSSGLRCSQNNNGSFEAGGQRAAPYFGP
jgi:hypothetical protein